MGENATEAPASGPRARPTRVALPVRMPPRAREAASSVLSVVWGLGAPCRLQSWLRLQMGEAAGPSSLPGQRQHQMGPAPPSIPHPSHRHLAPSLGGRLWFRILGLGDPHS